MKTIYENRKRVTRMMARCSQGVAKVYPRCSQALAILMSMLRVWLEYAYSMPRVCLQYAYSMPTVCLETKNLFPYWEQNIPTLGTKHSQAGNKTGFRLLASLLLMLVLGSTSVWGQAGVWYIANDNTSKGHPGKVYSSASDTEKYYLVPAANPQQTSAIDAYYSPDHRTTNGDSKKPFLTTALTNKDLNSIWIVMESGESGYYFIIHALTGKYVIYEVPLPNDPNTNTDGNETKNGKRKTMHLQTTDNGDYNPSTNDNFKFAITISGSGYNIRPKRRADWYWNPAGQNADVYYGQSSGEKTDLFRGGLVGVYDNTGTNSIWHFEDASSATTLTPVISDVETGTNTFTITSPAAAFSTIHYTTDGSTTPDANTGTTVTSGSPINITETLTVKAVGVFESFETPVAGPKELVPIICAKPVITYDKTSNTVTITSETEDANIYYTLDGEKPTSSSTPYGGPFSVTDHQTVKAIAIKTGILDSEIASLQLVLNPTITLAQTVYTYDGSEKKPGVSVKDGETTIPNNEYTVEYSNNTDAGEATVNIEDIAGDDLIVSGSANFTILRKAVTITANDASKTYDGTALTENGFTASELETGDTHTFTVVMTEGSTITNIGTEPNVIATVDGTAVTTGLVTTANGMLTVNPKAVIITANDALKAYDGTALTESGFTNTALETGDTHTFTVVMTEGSTITNIGTEPNVIATVDGTAVTTGIGNYLVTTANGTLTITPKPLTITAGSDTKVYDSTPLTKNSYTHTELLTGDKIEGVTVTGSQTDAGTSDNVLSAAVIKNSNNDDVTANYNITYTNGTLTVTPKPITVKADNKWKAYGEADPRLTYTSGGLLNNDSITGTLSRETGENVGTYAITVGGLTAGDNYAISFTSANLTIVKAELTVTANNDTITYGDEPAGNGVTCEGFVKNDTYGSLDGTLAYDFSYTRYGDVGNTYTIKPKGLTSSNYKITFSTGKLTVSPKEVGLTWSETTFPYDGSPHAPTATATGLVNGDVIGVTVSGAETNAGNSHTATASALTGTKKHNYKLPEDNKHTFTISPKSIGNGTTLADGYTLNFGENNTILLTDDVIGSALVLSTDYSVGEDTDTSEGYSERIVTGKGNYTGSFTVRNASVAFSTDTEQDRWSGTFVAEKKNEGDIGFALPEGFTAFIISDIQGEWAIPEPLNYIPADVPVLLVANHQTQGFVVTEAKSEKVTAITPDQKDKNMLEKVTESTPGYDATTGSAPFGTKQIYLLYKNEFVFNKAGNLKKGKVYLNPNHTASSPEPAPARLMIAWNHTTGIEDGRGKIEDGSSERWYTLDGRCLSGKPTTKGLYIVNGKKTVIK